MWQSPMWNGQDAALRMFVMPIVRIEGKFKLGQNRPMEDQQGVLHHLAASVDPIAHALGELTKTHLEKKGT